MRRAASRRRARPRSRNDSATHAVAGRIARRGDGSSTAIFKDVGDGFARDLGLAGGPEV